MDTIRGHAATVLLPEAVRTGKPRLVRYLIRQGADAAARSADGLTALQAAIANGRGDAVLELLVAGVRP